MNRIVHVYLEKNFCILNYLNILQPLVCKMVNLTSITLAGRGILMKMIITLEPHHIYIKNGRGNDKEMKKENSHAWIRTTERQAVGLEESLLDHSATTYTWPKKKRRIYNVHCIWGCFANLSQVWALILGLWVPGVVLVIIVTGQKWFSSLTIRFYRSWRRVNRRWRHECTRSDIVQICQKRFLRRSIILAWHRNCSSITDGVTLACNILIACSRSTCVRFGIVN